MNMKNIQKPSSVKRVYVSIREQPKQEQLKALLMPKPPSQPARFIRKRRDRCQTPESTNESPATVNKYTYHRSLSPYIPPKDSAYKNFCMPQENESLLPTPALDKEEGPCLPYELSQIDRTEQKTGNGVIQNNSKLEKQEMNSKRSKRASIRGLGKNIDLTKQVMTKAQLLVKFPERKEKRESFSCVSQNDENSGASKTPSPNVKLRDSRCSNLSKNFKISRQGIISEVEKQSRGKSEERSEVPWGNILKDLDNMVEFKDLPSFHNYGGLRHSVKLRSECK